MTSFHAPRGARRRLAIAVALMAPLLLASCMSGLGLFGPKVEIIEGAATSAPATVDPGSAAALISSYRKGRGLPAVSLDPKLMAIAASHARAMANANKMAHVLPGEGSFPKRLSAGGYDAAVAVENIAAGPKTLDQVFAAWKKSSGHNANMLKPGVTAMGIAVAHTANGRFNDYWALVLAAPDDRRAAAGPDAGPLVAIAR